MIGSKTYNVLRDLLAPEKPSAIRLEDLVLTFKGSLRPETSRDRRTISREQHEGEGVAAYSAVLKKCLEKALRDRFVCGLRNKETQKRLLAEKALTWKTAVEIALAMKLQISKPAISGIHQETPV